MNESERISLALAILRISVFLVMLMWTLDKFVRPEHAMSVFEKFYGLDGIGTPVMYMLAAAELVLLLAFAAGISPRLSYGAVFLLHGISTFSSYRQYLTPFEGGNLLFVTAWPMLAACFTLYFLRDLDTRWRISPKSNRPGAP
ncbi:MAG: hypothetical protein L0Y39_07380 [Methylococcaceae bacterium]|nr:hypothetical protein [Methylococcaceae bacterium]